MLDLVEFASLLVDFFEMTATYNLNRKLIYYVNTSKMFVFSLLSFLLFFKKNKLFSVEHLSDGLNKQIFFLN